MPKVLCAIQRNSTNSRIDSVLIPQCAGIYVFSKCDLHHFLVVRPHLTCIFDTAHVAPRDGYAERTIQPRLGIRSYRNSLSILQRQLWVSCSRRVPVVSAYIESDNDAMDRSFPNHLPGRWWLFAARSAQTVDAGSSKDFAERNSEPNGFRVGGKYNCLSGC